MIRVCRGRKSNRNMPCAQHPSDAPLGVCACCLRERLTDLLQLQQKRFRVPFSAPLPPPSPPSHDAEGDRIRRSESAVAQEHDNNGRTGSKTAQQFSDEKPSRGKFPFSSRFKMQGQAKHTVKMHMCGAVEGSRPSRHAGREENSRTPRAWISALLAGRHRKKSDMPAAAPLHSKNLSLSAARSSSDETDMVGRDEAFHEQLMNSRPAFEDYYSDSDLTKRSGGGGEAKGRILSGLKTRGNNSMMGNGRDTGSRAASCSTTARVNIFSASEDDESGKSSPRQGKWKTGSSGGFPSPTPKAKGWRGAGLSTYKHPDCAGSFSPYTDRKLQSSKPFSMARRENCASPRKLFNHKTSRSPRHGGKLSTFFFSPLRRTN